MEVRMQQLLKLQLSSTFFLNIALLLGFLHAEILAPRTDSAGLWRPS